MKQFIIRCLIVGTLVCMIVGCATQVPFKVHDLTPNVISGDYVQKVDHFIIILDISGSMAYFHQLQPKMNIARHITCGMNQTIPGNLKLNVGVRIFGKGLWDFDSGTERVLGMTRYVKDDVDKLINQYKWPSGESHLSSALFEIKSDLKSLHGNTAVIIVSDGKDLEGDPLQAVKAIKKHFKDSIYIHTIHIGDNEPGKSMLQQIAKLGEGEFRTQNDIMTGPPMAEFVKTVFLQKAKDTDQDGVYDHVDQCPDTLAGVKVSDIGCPFDSDHDGIYNEIDQCPDTPKNIKVNASGCPLDTDADGVYDYLDECPDTETNQPVNEKGCVVDSDKDGIPNDKDQCPDTPEGAKVNDDGCWIIRVFYFDTNKKEIKAKLLPYLEEIVNVLNRHPNLKLEIQGHTDSVGKESYNWKLSEKRAKSIMDYLIQMKIPKDRLSITAYGPSMPAAPNSTAEGRRLNRRAEFRLIR